MSDRSRSMEASQLLKSLKDDGWYLGDTMGPCRQYVNREQEGVITVCVRYTDVLGPEALATVQRPASPDVPVETTEMRTEATPTGFSAYVPGLPGCVATGATEAEARARMSGALALHIAGIRAT